LLVASELAAKRRGGGMSANVLKYSRHSETPPEQIFADDVLCCLGHDEAEEPGNLYVAHDEAREFVGFVLSVPGKESAFMTLTASQARALGKALLIGSGVAA